MWRLFYSLLLLLALPFIVARLYGKSLAAPDYRRRIGERFALFKSADATESTAPAKTSAGIWIHAVSVGETVAAAPLVKALRSANPNVRIIITTTTPTGSERVRSLFGDAVTHVYAPYDLEFLVRRFLRKIRPGLLIIMETELWPNTIAACKQENVKILLANARLSERSAAGYRRISSLARQMLMAIDLIAAQSQADADRLMALGAEASKVEVTGSLKFYVDVDTTLSHNAEPFSSIKASGRTVIVIASTREGEESKVLDAILPLLDAVESPLCILIPRHPERFQGVAELCQKRGLRLQRRSSGQALAADTQVLLGDSMGEMMAYYSLGDIAFVGGSLVDTGCQNVLEPAAWALPVLVGPSQFNFAKICSQMESANALRTVQDATELSTQLRQLLDEPAKREAMGQSGAALVKANRSALPKLLAQIDRLLA